MSPFPDPQHLQELGKLARLSLDTQEATRLAAELHQILAYIDHMGEPAALSPTTTTTRLRVDHARTALPTGQAVCIPPVRGMPT